LNCLKKLINKVLNNSIEGFVCYEYKESYWIINPITNQWVVKVGSRPHGVSKISMKSELYNITRKLFGLNHVDTSRYFNRWLNNIPADNK
jgi:hypothetical protein